MVMYKKLFLIIDLKARRKTVYSNIGASITADINIYIGEMVNSFLMVVSFVDMPPPNELIKILQIIITITLII